MIDVIIPAYNAEKTLQRAVQSVLNQPELSTLWIVDDASNDNTLAFAESFLLKALLARYHTKSALNEWGKIAA